MEIAIIGNGTQAQLLTRYIRDTDFGKVVAYVVDKEFINENTIGSIPVLAIEDFKNLYSPDDIKLVMGIGYKKMGDIRKQKYEQFKKMAYTFVNYIHPTAILPKDIVIGDGNVILENVLIEMGTHIGNANLFFGGAIVSHESTIGSYNTFAPGSILGGKVNIANNCFLGLGSVVKSFVSFSDYVLLGAMAYGFKDMEEYSVIVPAKSAILEDRKSTDFI